MPLLFSDTLRKGSTILCPCELDVFCLYKSFMKCPLKLFHAKHCHAAVWHPRLMESFLNIQKQKQLVLGRAMGQKREIHSVPPIICGGALPRLPAPTLAEGQSLSCSSDWEDAAGLGKPIARCTSPQLCACFATLQAGKWWKLVVVFCSYCGKHSRILCPDAPHKIPLQLYLSGQKAICFFYDFNSGRRWSCLHYLQGASPWPCSCPALLLWLERSLSSSRGTVHCGGDGRDMAHMAPLLRILSKPRFKSGVSATYRIKVLVVGKFSSIFLEVNTDVIAWLVSHPELPLHLLRAFLWLVRWVSGADIYTRGMNLSSLCSFSCLNQRVLP